MRLHFTVLAQELLFVDVSGFRVFTAASQIIAFRGPGEWSSEDISKEGTVFLTLAEPIHADDKAYFLLKMYGEKPLIKWITFDPSKNKLAEGQSFIHRYDLSCVPSPSISRTSGLFLSLSIKSLTTECRVLGSIMFARIFTS